MEFSTVVQLLICTKLPLTLVLLKFCQLASPNAIGTANTFTSNS